MKRLMLLELLNADPAHPYPAESFPFLLGAMRQAGIQARWLRYGIGSSPADRCPVLPADVARDFLREAAAFEATHVLSNVGSPALEQALEALGAVSWRVVDEAMALASKRLMSTFFDWLGRPRDQPAWGDDDEALELIDPVYDVDVRNHAARQARIMTELYCGATCHYRRPVLANTHFAGMVFPEGTSELGCSFCAAGADTVRLRRPVEDLVLRQLVAVRKHWPVDQRPEFVLGGGAAFHRIPAIVESVLQARLPRSALLFSCRIDEFLRRKDQIERVLPRLGEAGHVLGIQRMGVENLSPVENDRLNKGISAEQVLESSRELARLEREFPGVFAFSAYGGFGFITFTPWTTFHDLQVNIDVARQLLLVEEGYFTRSRLQLRPGLAITELARRDGLLVHESEDHSFFSGCIRFANDFELPWRFRDPRVGVVFSVVRRVGVADDIPPDDRLLARVQRFLLQLPLEALGCVNVLELLVRAASKRQAPSEPDVLMDQTICEAREWAGHRQEELPGPVSGAGLVSLLSAVAARHPALLHGFRPLLATARSPAIVLQMGLGGQVAEVKLERRANRPSRASSQRYNLTLLRTSTADPVLAGAMVERCAQLLDRIPPWKG